MPHAYGMISAAAAGLVAASLLSAPPAAAQDDPFFKGKTVQLLIGFGPGGNNDQWARLLARHIPKHIPGAPNVVPQNMPGAGGLKVANHLYNVAPKDGTAWGLVARGVPLEPLMGGKGTDFEPLKFTYLGSPARDTTVCAVTRETPVKTIDDFLKTEVIFGSTGSGAESHVIPLLLDNVLGMKLKIISGYKGSTDILLAMERKEVQGVCLAWESLARRAPVRDGRFRPAFQASLEPDPDIKNVPHVFDLKMSQQQRDVLELIFVRDVLGRPFLAPPGLPADRAKMLQDAFMATMKDKDFVADAQKQKLTVTPVSGSELARVLAKAYAAPPEIVKRAADALGR